MVGLFEVLIILTVTVYRVAMHEEGRLRKGPWLEEEDELLTTVVSLMGERRWDSLAKASGLRRSGKSCRMRWLNYLHPNLKRGRITAEEEQTIFLLHQRWGNKWSKIAQKLPGRTDNEIKNYWRCHMRKKGGQAYEEHKEEGFSANCSSSGTTIEISNYWFSTSSPYETQLSDWISSWSDEQSFRSNNGVFSDKCEGVSDEGSLWGCNSSGCLWVWDAN